MKDLKEVVKLAVSLVNALGAALEDGKLDYSDLLEFWPVITDFGAAIENIEQALVELKSLDEKSLKDLIAQIKDDFDIPQDRLEIIAESALDILAALFKTYVLAKK